MVPGGDRLGHELQRHSLRGLALEHLGGLGSHRGVLAAVANREVTAHAGDDSQLAVLWRRGGTQVREAVSPGVLVAGVGMFTAYALTLAALRLAPAAAVAAVRECSVVIATGMAAAFLGERVGPGRTAGAVTVTAGIILIAVA